MMPSPSDNTRDKRALLIGGLLILLVSAYFIGKSFFFKDEEPSPLSSAPAVTDAADTAPTLAPDVLLQKIRNGDKVALLDVRTAEAFQGEHLAHSLSVPIGALENFSPVQGEAVVIVFSENDLATLEAAKNVMDQKSFPYFFLEGGFEGWKALGAPLVSSGDPDSFVDQSKVTYISLEESKKLLAQTEPPVYILDVQAEDAFKKKHLKGAVNIPLDQLEKRSNEIPAGRQIIVYGENSLASFRGGVRLSDLGIFSAFTLEGDRHLSPESGLPLEP